ncbi:hypothetical protein BTUL_0299g00030 [Botrytis tulipae]|uniref:Uncharacterized protein n=1 Tax=Botrytis tulipae TaxID=87230 RepID=A0A4Z1E5A4_9HELO|nr:hypothetical protein BTUL_0299g00030 [Botrytis tulipae]
MTSVHHEPDKGFDILSMEEAKWFALKDHMGDAPGYSGIVLILESIFRKCHRSKHRVLVRERKKAVMCHDKNEDDDFYAGNSAINSRMLSSQSVKSVKTDNHELIESVTHAVNS